MVEGAGCIEIVGLGGNPAAAEAEEPEGEVVAPAAVAAEA
tara:strand:+ start:65 stop:184 length:120 start_codon:yes stop_codon:yes gene_type:complete